MAIKIEAQQRLTANPLASALKMAVQTIVDDDASAQFKIVEGAPCAKVVSSDPHLPVITLDHSSSKALATLLARYPEASMEIRATGVGKIEIELIDEN